MCDKAESSTVDKSQSSQPMDQLDATSSEVQLLISTKVERLRFQVVITRGSDFVGMRVLRSYCINHAIVASWCGYVGASPL
jgi:hypothetical protein